AKEQPSGWYALDVDLEPAAREAVEYALMEAGALGTETGDESDGVLRITGYFASTPDRERVRSELFEALRIYDLPSSSVRDMNVREVAQRDWLEEWKQNWQPVEIGRFVIAPPWSNLDDVHDRLIIRIEPGMAFGTGTHETTRLCLQAIEKHFTGGSFLDVGTGTGILAIAAAKLFPEARIEACDTDEMAVAIARENAVANGVADQIDLRAGSVEESTASADLVCANLTADVITQILPSLVSLTCGKLILSGILETQVEMVQAGLHDNGIDEFEIEQDGEWVALIV
ncbi:MAG TPA: 50S ribosomal protein L11 methyltransferase, partial [Pyrinomonadaceae bacterium]|nr:50S ribosomal protein L11 methyltransferase [Pyrinomonadaceae bacterium]